MSVPKISKTNNFLSIQNKVVYSFIFINLIYGPILKELSLGGVSTSEILVFRGLLCLIICWSMAIFESQSLRPNRPYIQLLRFSLTGSSVWFIIASYSYLPISAILTINRMDLPLSLLFSTWSKRPASRKQRGFALFALAILLLALQELQWSSKAIEGCLLAGGGTIMLAITYLLMKVASENENEAVVITIPALSSFFFGLLGLWFIDSRTLFDLSLEGKRGSGLIIIGILTYISYRLGKWLFGSLPLAKASLPFLAIPILSIPIDIYFFNHHFTLSYVLAVLGVCFLLLLASRESS